MENMLQMLLTGDFRRWGAIQHAQYTRWFGCVQHIGIEIESERNPMSPDIHALEIKGFIRTNCRTGAELTYLFDCTDAQKFYNKTIWAVQQLGNRNFPTLGGLHINVQFGAVFNVSMYANERDESKKYKYIVKRCVNTHKDVINNSSKYAYGRIEFKRCSPFIEPIDLLSQMLICAAMVHRANTEDLRRLVNCIRLIRATLPNKSMLIDLDAFLRTHKLIDKTEERIGYQLSSIAVC